MNFEELSANSGDIESFLSSSDTYDKKYLKIEIILNRREDELSKDIELNIVRALNKHLEALNLQVSKFFVLKRELYKEETKCRLEIEIPEFYKEYQRVKVLSAVEAASTELWGIDFYGADFYDLELRHLDVQFSSEHTGIFTDEDTDFLFPEIKEEIEREVNKALHLYGLQIAYFDGTGSLIGDYTLEHGFYILIPENYKEEDIDAVIKSIDTAIRKVLSEDLLHVYSYDYYRDENY